MNALRFQQESFERAAPECTLRLNAPQKSLECGVAKEGLESPKKKFAE